MGKSGDKKVKEGMKVNKVRHKNRQQMIRKENRVYNQSQNSSWPEPSGKIGIQHLYTKKRRVLGKRRKIVKRQ